MAEIRVEGDQVSIRLSLPEKIGALHGNLTFPRSAIRTIRVVEKPFAEIHGIRSPGTRIPAVLALGTWRRRGERDFVAVYCGERGVIIEVDASQAKYQRVILSTKDPNAVHDLLAGNERR